MENLTKYTFSGKQYVLADDVLELDIKYLDDCTKSKDIVDKEDLTSKDFTYARLKNGKYTEVKGKNNKSDSVMISTKWVESHIAAESEASAESEEEIDFDDGSADCSDDCMCMEINQLLHHNFVLQQQNEHLERHIQITEEKCKVMEERCKLLEERIKIMEEKAELNLAKKAKK